MKLSVVLVALACVWCTSSAEEGCTSSVFPSFKLEYGQVFAIPEGCFRFKCKGGNLYEMSQVCYDLYKGYPADKYKQKLEERGRQLLNAQTCRPA